MATKEQLESSPHARARPPLVRQLTTGVAPAAFGVLALAVVLRMYLLVAYPFDGLYGQDAYAYYGYARELLSALPFPPPFWWPLGYPVLLDAAFLIGGESVRSAQWVTLLSGALVAPAALLLAREAAPRGLENAAGWVAGLLCATCGQLTQSSLVIMADAPALLWASLAGWLLLRYGRGRALWTLGIGAFALGLAIWTRWQNLLFAGAWLAALISIEWLNPEFGRTHRFAPTDDGTQSGRTHRFAPTVSGAWRLMVALGMVALVLSPQLMIRFTTGAPLAGQSWLEGWSPANFFARSFDTPDGHFDYTLPVAVFYAQVLAHPGYVLGVFVPFFLLGAWQLLGTRAQNPSAAILMLGWIGAMYLFLAGIPYENFRFGLAFLTPVAVTCGIGVGYGWARYHARGQRSALVAWILLGLGIMLYKQPRVLAPILEIKARELEQTRWLSEQLSPNATVWTLGMSGAIDTYTALSPRELWQVSLQEVRATAPAYLFLDTNAIETQWQGREPQVLLRALWQDSALSEMGEFHGWTLFRIR